MQGSPEERLEIRNDSFLINNPNESIQNFLSIENNIIEQSFSKQPQHSDDPKEEKTPPQNQMPDQQATSGLRSDYRVAENQGQSRNATSDKQKKNMCAPSAEQP